MVKKTESKENITEVVMLVGYQHNFYFSIYYIQSGAAFVFLTLYFNLSASSADVTMGMIDNDCFIFYFRKYSTEALEMVREKCISIVCCSSIT